MKYTKNIIITTIIVATLSILIVAYFSNAITTRTRSEDDTFNSLNVVGTLQGDSPVKMRQGLEMIDSDDNIMFQLGVKSNGGIGSEVDSGFDDTLFLMTRQNNANYIEFVIWDSELNRPLWAFNEGIGARANVSERSLMIGSSGVYDGDYTLCFNNNYVGCDTDVTGADLLVQDDIEAVGDIFSQGDIVADGIIYSLEIRSGASYITNLYATDANITTANVTTINNTTLNASNINTTNFDIYERSTDIVQPSEGHCGIWLSDGTQKGDDGDLLIACSAGGSTTWGTLFDKSAGISW